MSIAYVVKNVVHKYDKRRGKDDTTRVRRTRAINIYEILTTHAHKTATHHNRTPRK